MVSISRLQRVGEAIWFVRAGEAGLTSTQKMQKTLSSVTMTTVKGRRHRRVYLHLRVGISLLGCAFFSAFVSLFCVLSGKGIQMLVVSLT